MKKEMNKAIAGALTLIVLAILLISGPAEAYILGLTVLEKEVERGKKISFSVNVKIESTEHLAIDYFLLKIRGNTNTDCKFNVSGDLIDGCAGISIQRTSVPDFGYGYGYGYGYLTNGDLTYNITLDTNSYYLGSYSTEIVMSTDGKEASQKGGSFKIFSKDGILNGCSLRADDGILQVRNSSFKGKNKLNFNIPLEGAKMGEGYMIFQADRNRFSYQFVSPVVLENNKTTALILVEGKYRMNVGETVQEKAIFSLDKNQKSISIIGGNFSVMNMNVNLMQKC